MYKIVYRITTIVLVAAVTLGIVSMAGAASDSPAGDGQTLAKPRVYAYYYLWWSAQHWQDKLGSNYPYTASPLQIGRASCRERV